MKKIIQILLIPILLLSFCEKVFAETIYTEDTLKYVIRDNEVVIVKYFGREDVVTIPRTINNMPVTTIGSGAFVDTYAKKVILPDSIVYVEAGAFSSSVEYNWDGEFIDPPSDDPEKDDDNPEKGDDDPEKEDDISVIDNNEGQIVELPTYGVDEVSENGEVDIDGNVITKEDKNLDNIDNEIITTKPSKIDKSFNLNPLLIVILVVLVTVIVFFIIKVVKKNNDRSR